MDTRKRVLSQIRAGQKKLGITEADIDQLEKLETANEVNDWVAKHGINLVDQNGKAVDLASRLNLKTVTITADAGEQIVVDDGGEMQTEAMEDEPEGEEDEPVGKRAPRGGGWKSRVGVPQFGGGRGPSVRSRVGNMKSVYDRAVREGGTFHGKRPDFESADMAEAFGAYARLQAMGHLGYEQKSADRKIIEGFTGKALGTETNALGGALDPDLFDPTLIELKGKYGAIRQATGVTTMQDGSLTMPRLTADVTVSKVGQNSPDTDQDKPNFDNVTLRADELSALVRTSKVLLHDSALSVADIIAGSMARAFAKYEDDNLILAGGAANGWSPIASKIGTTSTYDATLSTGWEDYTAAKINTGWIGKLPGIAWREGNVAIICNFRFYASVLRGLIATSAGGRLVNDFLDGSIRRADAGAVGDYDGIPVYFTDSMPATYSADQTVAYVGSFASGCKFGEVAGSSGVETSDQRYFEYRQVAFMGTQRIAFNPHDVSDSTDSLVIALKD